MRRDQTAAAATGVLGGPPLRLDGDVDLVRACLALGGFPRAVVLGGCRTVWAGPDGGPWSFGGASAKARRGRATKGRKA